MANQDNLDPIEIPNVQGNEIDTQDSNSAAPVDVDGHAESNTSTSAPVTGQPDEATVQAALREYGKLKQVQKELDDMRVYRDRYSNIENKAMRSPEAYKRALIEYNDMSEEQAEAEVNRLRSSGRWQQPVARTAQNTSSNSQDIYSVAAQIAEETFNKKQEAAMLQKEFFDRIPQMDPKNIPSEQKQSVGTFAAAIEYEARRRVSKDSSLNLVDAMVNVYREYTGKTEAELQEAREAGRRQGYLEANSVNAQSAKPSRGYTAKESSFGLTPQQLEEARAEGLTAEQYAKYSKPIAQIE